MIVGDDISGNEDIIKDSIYSVIFGNHVSEILRRINKSYEFFFLKVYVIYPKTSRKPRLKVTGVTIQDA